MRGIPGEEYPEFVRRLREQARRDAEELVPRPGFPVYGLAAPALTPAFLADSAFMLAAHVKIGTAVLAGRDPRRGREWAAMHRALWQRAVSECQRLAGQDAETANEVVTSAVNHLQHLDADAAWFAAGGRLRETAIGETLRYAMLGEKVASRRAQYLWARLWTSRMTGLPGRDLAPGPDAHAGGHATRERFEADWLAAWEAWTADR